MAEVPKFIKEHDVAVAPARAAVKVTPGASDLPDGVCRSLWAGTAGTATLIDACGNTCTDFPLIAGPNPISVRRVTSLGTAADVWALY